LKYLLIDGMKMKTKKKNNKSNGKIKAIIFDWDMTLANTLVFHAALMHYFCEKYDVSFLDLAKNVRELFGMNIKVIMSKYFNGHNISQEYIEKYNELSHLISFSGKETIEKLKRNGYKVAIVTNDFAEPIEAYLKSEKIKIDFVIGTPKNKPKPDPYALRKALRELKIKPKEAVFIGDHPHDIEMGHNAGTKTIAFDTIMFTHHHYRKFKPDMIIDHFYELDNAIESLKQK